jgi:hypothetical protein
MKGWLPSLIAVTVGICIGCGVGYAGALWNAANKNVLLIDTSTGNSFQQIFTDIGKLYAFEALASNCKGSTDMPSVLANEDALIQKLRRDANGSGLTPPIDVAEARLVFRGAIWAGGVKATETQSEQIGRAEKLLENSGWGESSGNSRMREVILAIDHEECGQPSTKGSSMP